MGSLIFFGFFFGFSGIESTFSVMIGLERITPVSFSGSSSWGMDSNSWRFRVIFSTSASSICLFPVCAFFNLNPLTGSTASFSWTGSLIFVDFFFGFSGIESPFSVTAGISSIVVPVEVAEAFAWLSWTVTPGASSGSTASFSWMGSLIFFGFFFGFSGIESTFSVMIGLERITPVSFSGSSSWGMDSNSWRFRVIFSTSASSICLFPVWAFFNLNPPTGSTASFSWMGSFIFVGFFFGFSGIASTFSVMAGISSIVVPVEVAEAFAWLSWTVTPGASSGVTGSSTI